MADMGKDFYIRKCYIIIVFYALILGAKCETTVPAIYVIGDSAVDVGTNNYIASLANAEHPYNGIDFPGSIATGRFSNGYNVLDQIAIQFGFEKSPPPYLSLLNNMSEFKSQITRGVNFASAGAGLLDETGYTWKVVINATEQINQFELVQGNVTQDKGAKETAELLSKSLFIMCLGSNDIFDRYRSNSSITKEQLMAKLQSAYYTHLKKLYELGGRRFGIIGLPPLGCIPFVRALTSKMGGKGGCFKEINEFAKVFYPTVDTLLLRMSKELPGIKFSHGNVYKMTKFILKNFRQFGFKDIKSACCGNGKFNGEDPCWVGNGIYPDPKLCNNRTEYLFWDLYHPSEAATQLTAQTLFGGANTYVKPVNFSQLSMLN